MQILLTGVTGFIGKNLQLRLQELGHEILSYARGDTDESLHAQLKKADVVIHLAGENRPATPQGFIAGNIDLTARLCAMIKALGRPLPIVFSSSAQAMLNNPYGQSKLAAERLIAECTTSTDGRARVYRLPGVFGKWCKPNYNSVVATFCHNIARDLPIQIRDPAALLRLVYVDDVVTELIEAALNCPAGYSEGSVQPEYSLTLEELAERITAFRDSRKNLTLDRVGTGFMRALYSTYVSYLPPERFVYDLPLHSDNRGVFVEMLKTPDCGQFSFFTARPGVTRGGHYHHSKTEKFLVIRGQALFRFRHMQTGKTHELQTSGATAQVVETVPGWTHDITNVGQDEMVVMLWANEIFDRARPDTINCPV